MREVALQSERIGVHFLLFVVDWRGNAEKRILSGFKSVLDIGRDNYIERE